MSKFQEVVREIEIIERKQSRQNLIIAPVIKAIRTQLIDWLMIVCEKLSLRDETLFLTIEIIDKMLIKYNFDLSGDDIHLISVVSLFIASKYEEVIPLRMKTIIEKVAHSKYSKNDLLATEMLILKKLNFQIPRNHFLDFSYTFSEIILSNKNVEFKTKFEAILKSTYKMSLFEWKLCRNNDIVSQYFSLFVFALNKAENINNISRKVYDFSKQCNVEKQLLINFVKKIEKVFSTLTDETHKEYPLFKQTNKFLVA